MGFTHLKVFEPNNLVTEIFPHGKRNAPNISIYLMACIVTQMKFQLWEFEWDTSCMQHAMPLPTHHREILHSKIITFSKNWALLWSGHALLRLFQEYGPFHGFQDNHKHTFKPPAFKIGLACL